MQGVIKMSTYGVICPFFVFDYIAKISCENQNMKFEKAELKKEHKKNYCSSYEYKKCPNAQKLIKYYDKKYGN